jgi:ribonuclease VapC
MNNKNASIVVDASAIVAIIEREEGWKGLSECLDAAQDAVTTSLALFEATLAVARHKSLSPEKAEFIVKAFLNSSNVEVVSILPREGSAAVAAFARFGKGRHPAALNMGDCFIYASAVTRGRSLLYKGDDFRQTDIRSAMDMP